MPLEELIGAQALSADLKTALFACLTGRESRRWTVGELFDRLNENSLFAATSLKIDIVRNEEIGPQLTKRLIQGSI